MKIIETERLILRTWEDADAEIYFQINQDPQVLECLPGSLTIEQVKKFSQNMNEQQEKRGFTLWAAELKESKKFIGFIGLNFVDWDVHFTGAVEIGWRLDSKFWGQGLATEGAKAARDFAFNKLHLKEIVALTVPQNKRSRRVMEKIGMKQDMDGNFKHPKLPANHRLSEHVLYRISVV